MKVTLVKSPTLGVAAGDVGRLLIFSEEERRQFPAQRHDLSQAVMRLETALEMLRRGFDFTTPDGARHLMQLREAVVVVGDQAKVLQDIWSDDLI